MRTRVFDLLCCVGVLLALNACGKSPTEPGGGGDQPSISPSSAQTEVGRPVPLTVYNVPDLGVCTSSSGGSVTPRGNAVEFTSMQTGTYTVTCLTAKATVQVVPLTVQPEVYTSVVAAIHMGSSIKQIPAGAFTLTVDPRDFKPLRGGLFPGPLEEIGWAFTFSVAASVAQDTDVNDLKIYGYYPYASWYNENGETIKVYGGLQKSPGTQTGVFPGQSVRIPSYGWPYRPDEIHGNQITHIKMEILWGKTGNRGFVEVPGLGGESLVLAVVPWGAHK